MHPCSQPARLVAPGLTMRVLKILLLHTVWGCRSTVMACRASYLTRTLTTFIGKGAPAQLTTPDSHPPANVCPTSHQNIMAAQWLDDGSETLHGEGKVVSCTAEAKGDSVFHALWTGDGPVSSGTHYWEIEDREGLSGVGMTTQEKFSKGYACRSFNMNSINLSDGGALLVGKYGPGEFKAGDKIGLLCEMTDAALTITFYHNGRCLGPAFQVASPYPQELFPVVTFKHGKTSAAIEKVATIPSARAREAAVEAFPAGDWKDAADVRLTISRRGNDIMASLHVVNNVNMKLTHADGVWKAHQGMSTMMAGPPEKMQLEKEYTTKFQELNNIRGQNGDLVIAGPSGDLIFSPAAPDLDIPYTKNPLAKH